MLFTEGTEVKEGDPLFALDKKPFEERLAAANGMLAEAKAALNKYREGRRPAHAAGRRSAPFRSRTWTTPSPRWTWARRASCPRKARVESAKIDLGYCDVTRAAQPD